MAQGLRSGELPAGRRHVRLHQRGRPRAHGLPGPRAAAAEAGGVAAVGDASANGGDVDDAFGGVAALREKVMHWRSVRA